MNDLQIYEDHAQRYERAYGAWLKTYLLEHPEPARPPWYRGLPWLMIPFGVIAVAGIALSALRTAPTFASIAEAVVGVQFAVVEAALAVLVIEVSMVVIRYVLVVQHSEAGQPLNVDAWMTGGFWLAFGIALLANVYASVSHLPVIEPIKPFTDLVMALAVGISAPILAFISGDVLASLWVRSDAHRAGLRLDYEHALDEWRDAKERRWSTRKADYGVRIQVEPTRMDIQPPQPLPSSSIHPSSNWMDDGRRMDSSFGFQKTANGQEQVKRWLDANPQAADWSSKQIAVAAGVRSPQTANEARKAWKLEVERGERASVTSTPNQEGGAS